MSKFKVGDKVVLAPGKSGVEYFYALQGKREYCTITDTASASGYWLQLDGVVRGRVDHYPWHWSFFNMYQEPEDELPPVPDKVAYMNSKRDPGNDQRLVLEKDNGDGEGLMYIGVVPKKGSTRAKVEIGINIDPDSALQLAHDLRRMAMDIKRKEKAQ
jgi:hypothetical protein|nr:MAG TPA: hypothetical protein [Caudoviricetes sp.]